MHATRLTTALVLAALATTAAGREDVILLHGLARTDRSMVPMEEALMAAGFAVTNVRYPSRSAAFWCAATSPVTRCRSWAGW